mmetsp:Transcript_19211/g.24930  ORF Transcript_19211/g.24930 Transcript_19211/m.24930 type:complete len:311 (-) Transcript_19211:234-1166(-)
MMSLSKSMISLCVVSFHSLYRYGFARVLSKKRRADFHIPDLTLCCQGWGVKSGGDVLIASIFILVGIPSLLLGLLPLRTAQGIAIFIEFGLASLSATISLFFGRRRLFSKWFEWTGLSALLLASASFRVIPKDNPSFAALMNCYTMFLAYICGRSQLESIGRSRRIALNDPNFDEKKEFATTGELLAFFFFICFAIFTMVPFVLYIGEYKQSGVHVENLHSIAHTSCGCILIQALVVSVFKPQSVAEFSNVMASSTVKEPFAKGDKKTVTDDDKKKKIYKKAQGRGGNEEEDKQDRLSSSSKRETTKKSQ